MKRILLFLILIAPLISEAKKIQAVISNARFYSKSDGAFIEFYLSVAGHSVNYKLNNAGKFQAAIQISLNLKDSSGKSVFTDNYNLLSPTVDDTNKINFNFLDQKRIAVSNGIYVLETGILDKNSTNKALKIQQKIYVYFDQTTVSTSDIVLIDSYEPTKKEGELSKCGYDMIPYVDNFYPKSLSKLAFYLEIYNTTAIRNPSFLLTYHIETDETHQILDNFKVYKKSQPSEVMPLLAEFDITDLVSGNYKLMVEIRDKENNLIIYKDLFFQRSNAKRLSAEMLKIENLNVENTWVSKYTNKDSLIEYVACLRPISNAEELIWQDTQLKLAQPKLMQQYIFDFWQRKNADDPEGQWNKYKEQVNIVNESFGSKRIRGYQTEMGRVYLQYGPPSTIVENLHEPDAYPYQIWHYYKIKSFSNKRFIFYNSDLTNKYYTLLSSDMQGEFYDAQWQMKLYKRNTQSNDMDVEKRQQNFGNRVEDLYNDPH